MALTHLLYLHGFRSSPLSTKARVVGDWVARHRPEVHWWCPQLPPSPAEALALIRGGVADWPAATTAVIGSSLGGFYATVLAEALGCPAVLLNPAVHPERDLARHIGEQSTWQSPQDRFYFHPRYIAELAAMKPLVLSRPERYAAVIATGDEVLDWREMAHRYRGARVHLIDGGDHAISDFDAPLHFLLDALGLLHAVTPAGTTPSETIRR